MGDTYIQLTDLVAVPIKTGAVSGGLLGRNAHVTTVVLAETTGAAAASVDVIDGNDASGPVILPIRLAQGTSVSLSLGRPGVPFGTGVYLRVNSGSVVGSLTAGTPVIIDAGP